MATNAWGVQPTAPASAWADAVDEEEEKHGAVLAPLVKADDDFPSLAVTKNVKETKKDKKKKQTVSLAEFMRGGSSKPSDDAILFSLPTAPRGRGPGEAMPERGLGGGFREYGGQRGGFGRGRDDDDGPPRRMREEDMGPSRAEASDNWGRDRKFEPGTGGDRGRGFGGSFRDRDGSRDEGFGRRERGGPDDGPSRADTTDNWGANRQFVPSGGRSGGAEDRPRGGSGGFSDRYEDRPRSGFGDRDRERGGFGDRERPSFREPSKADTEDRWERRGEFQPTAFEDRPARSAERFEERPRGRGFGDSWGASRDSFRDGPRRDASRDDRDGSQDRWARRGGEDAGPPPAAAAPGERPRLSLAPRSAPVERAEGGESAPAAPKSNPFGAARPREEVLREQGRDYRKEELQLEHKAAEVLREESEEERELQKQIEDLRTKVEAGEADAPLDPSEGAEGKTVSQALEECEVQLSKLQLELDDKVRYARRQAGEGSRREREEGGRGFSQERGEPRGRPEGRRYEEPREGGRGFEGDRERREERREYRSHRGDPRSADGRGDREAPARSRW
ncbi:hypothetical protein N2152v2_007645 [Parachlorella kessleri]